MVVRNCRLMPGKNAPAYAEIPNFAIFRGFSSGQHTSPAFVLSRRETGIWNAVRSHEKSLPVKELSTPNSAVC
jgi:hypothetical protein